MADLYIKMGAGKYDRSQELIPGVVADYDIYGALTGLEVNSVWTITLDTGGVVQVSIDRTDLDRMEGGSNGVDA